MKQLYESILSQDFDINDTDVFINHLKSKRWSTYKQGYAIQKKSYREFFDDFLYILEPMGHKLKDIDDCIEHTEKDDFMMAINKELQSIYVFTEYSYSKTYGPLYYGLSISIIPPESKNRAFQITRFSNKAEGHIPPINKDYAFNTKGNPVYYTISRDDFRKLIELFDKI